MFGLIPIRDRAACREKLAAARNEGLYTPPSTQGTLIFPMTGGGVNWGGAAFDPVNQILYANTSHAVHIIKLIPRAEAEGFKPPPGHDFGPQRGAPFAMTRARGDVAARHALQQAAMGRDGRGRSEGRENSLAVVGRHRRRIARRSGIAFNWGTPLVNGVVITAGGLVFTGAMDAYLRAFDAKSGAELWQGRLPVPGVANPMTYLWKGEQYVAIAAGGHSESGTIDRRQRGGVSAGAAGRGALAVVAHHRPARRTIPAARRSLFALAIGLMAVAVWRWRRARRRLAG